MTGPTPIPPNVKNPEQRLLTEYLVAKFPGFRHATRVPLGPELAMAAQLVRPGAALRASRPWRPEVDGMVWWNGTLLVIEAKVHEIINGIAKLPIYGKLIASTPELRDYRDWPIRLRLVTPRSSPWGEEAAAAAGVEIDTYEPDWMTAYWEWRDRYSTAEYRAARATRKAAIRAAGLG